jgi:hypothetical protein
MANTLSRQVYGMEAHPTSSQRGKHGPPAHQGRIPNKDHEKATFLSRNVAPVQQMNGLHKRV